jgi:hypothetical protein
VAQTTQGLAAGACATRRDWTGVSWRILLAAPLHATYQGTLTVSHILSEDIPGLPAGQMAQWLLADAQACPALIGRSGPASAVIKAEAGGSEPTPRAVFPAMALLSDPTLDIRRYLEELITIAVNSAQRVEDVSLQACEGSRKARRGMVAVGCLGALGLIVGIGGFAASRGANVRLSEVRKELGALQEMQRQAQYQLAGIALRQSDQQADVKAADLANVTREAATPLPAPALAPPAFQPSVRASEPWPDSRKPVPRPAAVHSRPVVVPQFFADIQRNLRTLFR